MQYYVCFQPQSSSLSLEQNVLCLWVAERNVNAMYVNLPLSLVLNWEISPQNMFKFWHKRTLTKHIPAVKVRGVN